MTRIALLCLLTLATLASAGELADHGPGGEYFHDSDSGLYWFDPAGFDGWTRFGVDSFIACATSWALASPTEVDALDGSWAVAGATLEEVMGPRQATVTGGGPRWVGFCGATDPDGWLLQATSGGFDTITDSSAQGGTESLTHGAWLVTATDPLTQPRLDHLGDTDLPHFHDRATGLYWIDPEQFVGQDRAEVASWLDGQPDWRWATREEIERLVGKRTMGDVPLTDVLGEPQYWATGAVPRWIGYYAQATAPDGMLVQGGGVVGVPMLTTASTQGGVASWNPGAWVVSEVNPTAVLGESLSDLKAMFAE